MTVNLPDYEQVCKLKLYDLLLAGGPFGDKFVAFPLYSEGRGRVDLLLGCSKAKAYLTGHLVKDVYYHGNVIKV